MKMLWILLVSTLKFHRTKDDFSFDKHYEHFTISTVERCLNHPHAEYPSGILGQNFVKDPGGLHRVFCSREITILLYLFIKYLFYHHLKKQIQN